MLIGQSSSHLVSTQLTVMVSEDYYDNDDGDDDDDDYDYDDDDDDDVGEKTRTAATKKVGRKMGLSEDVKPRYVCQCAFKKTGVE